MAVGIEIHVLTTVVVAVIIVFIVLSFFTLTNLAISVVSCALHHILVLLFA